MPYSLPESTTAIRIEDQQQKSRNGFGDQLLDTLGDDVQIFTHTLWNMYSAPQGFDFDIKSDDVQWINNEDSKDFNADVEAKELMRLLDDRAAHYLTNDVLVLFGDDFRYMDAFQYYQSLDNMIEYMNKNHGDKYVFRYSTPSDYVDALARHDVAWPTKYDDLFPYSDNPDAYWTGYYTSRPN